MWRSQTFENTCQGGYLLVLPYEALPYWDGKGPIYEDLCELSAGPIDYLQIGSGFGVFVAGPEGDIVHEAWWLRDGPSGPLVLAAWNEWGEEDRDVWLKAQLGREDLKWARHSEPLAVESGVLVLLHAEGAAIEARLAAADRTAVCGECVPAGVAAGRYVVEMAEIQELPEGSNCVELCRFVLISGEKAV